MLHDRAIHAQAQQNVKFALSWISAWPLLLEPPSPTASSSQEVCEIARSALQDWHYNFPAEPMRLANDAAAALHALLCAVDWQGALSFAANSVESSGALAGDRESEANLLAYQLMLAELVPVRLAQWVAAAIGDTAGDMVSELLTDLETDMAQFCGGSQQGVLSCVVRMQQLLSGGAAAGSMGGIGHEPVKDVPAGSGPCHCEVAQGRPRCGVPYGSTCGWGRNPGAAGME